MRTLVLPAVAQDPGVLTDALHAVAGAGGHGQGVGAIERGGERGAGRWAVWYACHTSILS